jgi:hypothetical protein
MRKISLSLLFLLTFLSSQALTDKVRLGFSVAPGISWFQPYGNNLKQGAVNFGMNYGVVVDYYFKDQNYGIQTGLFGGMENGEVRDRDVFGGSLYGVRERYQNQYIALPFYLKLKTNQLGGSKFRVFGQVGFSLVGTVSSRATFDKPIGLPIPTEITKENILRKDNAVADVIPKFRSNFFDFRLSVGAGFEYDVTDDIAVTFGVFYHNGFINVLADQDAKKNSILARNLLFSCGIMF